MKNYDFLAATDITTDLFGLALVVSLVAVSLWARMLADAGDRPGHEQFLHGVAKYTALFTGTISGTLLLAFVLAKFAR